MKALILAAGLGSRLRPLTDEFPKCMVKVNGKSIIDKQIENLKNNGVNEIYVVTGYKGDVLEKYLLEKYNDINIIKNEIYDKSNNMYSLYLSKPYLENSEFIMMNSDVFFEEKIITELIENNYENLIVCEKGNYNEESMKIIVKDEVIKGISKNVDIDNSYGTSIDVYRFGRNSSIKLYEIIYDYLYLKKDMNSWSEVAINDLIKIINFKSLDINYRWVEIDNYNDLSIAENLFKMEK